MKRQNAPISSGRGGETFMFRAGDPDTLIERFDPDKDVIMLVGIDAGGYEVVFNPTTGSSTITYAGKALRVVGVDLTSPESESIVHYGIGTAGNDLLDGGIGRDYLNGSSGDDFLSGGDNHDELHGGAGDDILYGGRGNDSMRGGSGCDLFYFSGNDGDDTIADFQQGEDIIKLGPEVGRDAFQVQTNVAGHLVLNFPGSSVTLANLTATTMGWGEDVTPQQMTAMFMELGWVEFSDI